MDEAIFHKRELDNCNACGFCQAACPIYRITRHEGSSARGHRNHLKALVADEMQPDSVVASHFAECLTCRACSVHCPTAVETDRIVIEGRSRIAAKRTALLNRSLFNHLLPDAMRLRRCMHLLRLGRTAPADTALSLLGRMALLPQGLQRAAQMLPGAQGGFLYERLGKLGIPSGSDDTIAYFMSCGMNYLTPNAGEASLRVLKQLGGEVMVLEHPCCGLPAYVAGEVEAARHMARQNISIFSQHTGPIVTDCASCSSFLKEYPRLVGDEAVEFAGRVRDFTEFVAERRPALPSASVSGRTVTYHDPCHLSRYQGLRDQPRQLLREIEGVEYRELPEADWCCGGAGTYAIRHAGLSEKILERKMNNVRLTGADILATACPGCLLQLEYGVKRWELPVRVVHISEVLAGTP